MKLRMGTRGSALALAQAGQLAERLIALEKGLDIETVIIKTSGDKFSAANPYEPGSPAGPGGGKGLFIKEIEEALLAGTIDFAVHSGKDLPADLAEGTMVAAWPAREEARDAFVGKGGGRLADLPKGARVASSSLRRGVQLKAARPDLQVVPMRGNVDTRIRKMEAGECEGLLLAEAGLRRLGRAELKREVLAVDIMVPSPVQGALAVQTRAALSAAAKIVAKLDDEPTRKAVEFERAVMSALGGGCSMPLGVYARPESDALRVDAFYSEADGSRFKRAGSLVGGSVDEARALAKELRG